MCCIVIVVSTGLRSSSSLCVACMMLPYESNTWGPLEIFTLLVHGVCTLMYFLVAPVSAMLYVCCWLGGIPIQLLHSIVLLFIVSLH